MLYHPKPSLGMLKNDVKSKSVNSPGQFGASPISTSGYMVAGSSGIDDVEGWSPGIYAPAISTNQFWPRLTKSFSSPLVARRRFGRTRPQGGMTVEQFNQAAKDPSRFQGVNLASCTANHKNLSTSDDSFQLWP
jgi:hypothetical protein